MMLIRPEDDKIVEVNSRPASITGGLMKSL
jgi:hypothetical protein